MEMVKEIFPNVSHIQHGVDMDVFKPDRGARDELRKRLGYEGKFVFLAVGRNNEMQKRYDIMLKAYKAFIENIPEAKEDTMLHIHANPHEVRGMDLEQIRNMGFFYISKELGREIVVFSKVRWNGEKLEICDQKDAHGMTLNPNWGLDEFEMAKLYNMADCLVHSGEGESFCIPCIESQACGIPQISPDHTSFPELVGKPKSGLLVKIVTEETTPTITDVKLVDILDLAKCMARMYKDRKLREECSKNAVENAKNYGWARIVDKWKFILEKVAEPKPTNYAAGDLGF
jgi:glycosyltransferase involved in cell wall biosynthesis